MTLGKEEAQTHDLPLEPVGSVAAPNVRHPDLDERADSAVARYIDGFQVPVRRHSSIGFQGALTFERNARDVSWTLSTKNRQVPQPERATHRSGLLARSRSSLSLETNGAGAWWREEPKKLLIPMRLS